MWFQVPAFDTAIAFGATYGLYGLAMMVDVGSLTEGGGGLTAWRACRDSARADELAERHCRQTALAMPREGEIIEAA